MPFILLVPFLCLAPTSLYGKLWLCARSFGFDHGIIISRGPYHLFNVNGRLPCGHLLMYVTCACKPILEEVEQEQGVSILLFAMGGVLGPGGDVFFRRKVCIKTGVIHILNGHVVVGTVLRRPQKYHQEPAPVRVPPKADPAREHVLDVTRPTILKVFCVKGSVIMAPHNGSTQLAGQLRVTCRQFYHTRGSHSVHVPVTRLGVCIRVVVATPHEQVKVIPCTLGVNKRLVIFNET